MAQLTIAPAFSASASSSASTSYPRYDVFINHRGPDCKHTFAIRLYRRLCDQGLLVFLDSEELIEGNNITSQLEAAIKGASVQVAIFSPTYAKSEWCLKELVLMVNSGATILPVFYDVEPSMVRRATRTYGEALQNLQQKRTRDPQTGELKPRYDSNTVQSWRDALLHVGDISGFVLHGDEFELLEKVVQSVRKNVPKTPLDVAKYPTGLDEKLRDLERMVEPEPPELKPVGAKILGIVGVGGVGKTTLAKHFFNLKSSDYNASSFLFDVRENARTGSLNYLQSQLIQELKHTDIKIESPDQGIGELKKHLSSCNRVLIILDDIDHIDQMEKLLPMKDSLSQESLILVTSRDRHVLRLSKLEEKSIYNLKRLNGPYSKKLFCSHAFFQSYPSEGFADLVDRFVTACDGLPLSLKVFGAAVCGRKQSYWEEILERLHERLPTEIQERLGISYESLEKEDQKIFLDIVCFFIGEEIDTAIRIWGTVGLENLESKCLLEVDSEKKIKMHDHIRDMGRIIAKQGSLPRRLSQIYDFLEQTSSGMTEVRGISMVPRVPDSFLFTSPSHLKDPKCKLFHKDRYDCMNLKFLATEGDYLEAILRRVPAAPLLWLRWDRILRRVPSAPLLWLRWYHCPYSSLPSWVPMENLRVLEVAGSRLETNFFGDIEKFYMKVNFRNVNINMSGASSLERFQLTNVFGNVRDLYITFSLSGASIVERLPIMNFVGDIEKFYMKVNFRNVNINMSGASSLERLQLTNVFGNVRDVYITFSLSGASIVERLPLMNFFGDIENIDMKIDFRNVNINMSSASSLERLQLTNVFGNVYITLCSGASTLERLPLTNFVGDIENFNTTVNFQNVNISASSWERLQLTNVFGNARNVQEM